MAFLKQLLKLRDANLAGDEVPPPVGINDKYIVPAQPGIQEQFPGSGRESMLQSKLAPLAETSPLEPTVAAPQRPASQGLMEQIQGIQSKDYSKAKYDESGNIIKPAGADRDKKWSLGEKVLGVVSGILEGIGSGHGLLGGAAKGIQYGTDRNFSEKQGDLRQLQKLGGQYTQAAADEEFQNKQGIVKAQTGDILRRPEKEQSAIYAKFALKTQDQINRLQVLAEKKRLEDASFDKLITKNGKWYELYKDGRQVPSIDPTTGEQEVNLLENPEEYTTESGKKVYMTGAQVGNVEATKAYRDATMALSRDQFEYKKQNDAEDRKVQIQKIQTDIEQSNRQFGLELEKFKRGEQTDKRLLDQLKAGIATRRAWIMSNKKLTPDEKQSLLAALPNDNVVQAAGEVK